MSKRLDEDLLLTLVQRMVGVLDIVTENIREKRWTVGQYKATKGERATDIFLGMNQRQPLRDIIADDDNIWS